MSKPLAPPQGNYAATVLGSISLEFALGPGTDESLRAQGPAAGNVYHLKLQSVAEFKNQTFSQ